MKEEHKVIFFSVVFGLSFWVIDSFLDYIFFYDASFWSLLVSDVPRQELYMRLVVIGLFIIFGVILSTILARRRQAEAALRRTSRAIETMGKCSHAVVYAAEEYKLLREICGILVEEGGYRMAWVGYVERDGSKPVYPVVHQGYEKGYLETLEVTWPDNERGRDPTGTAIRTGQPFVVRHRPADPNPAPWLAEAAKRGYASSIALPLKAEGKTLGALSIYSQEAEAFDDMEVKLLINLANDVAHGIAALRARAERRRAEEELRRERDRAQGYLDVAGVILLVLDVSGKVTMINRKGCEIWGYTEEEIIGRNVYDYLLPPRLKEDVREALNAFMTGERETVEYNENPILTKGGEERIIAWHNALLKDEAGDVVGLLCSGEDITDRRRAEEELHRAYDELEARVEERTSELAVAKERAESADRLKSAFLATMSHELRTPLNSIIGFTGILLQGLAGPLNEEQAKQLGMVRDSSRHLLELINDVLDISKIEAGQLEVSSEAFDMREAIDKVVRAVAPLAQKKGLALAAELSPGEYEIVSDRRRVEQILINLVNNAVKFTEQGEIRIECAADGDRLITRVEDTGIGIKPEDMEKVFKAFQQIDTGLARVSEGTGLGLAINKKLVEMLGGEIWVESEWGSGSTFSFMLPIYLSGEKDE